jgi:hypothetical protein
MKQFVAVLTVFISLNAWAQEKYMPNEAGGFLVLTDEACKFPEAVKQGYKWRAYATESDSEKPATHEGCWDSPSTVDAPKLQGVKIIPLVNVWFDGDQVTFPQTMFGDEKKRWDLKLPEIEVRPHHIPNSI